jgi:CBS domain-containing protein
MVPNPLTVAPEDTLRSAAELLTSAKIGGAPVMTDGTLRGIVTLADILAFEAEQPGVSVSPLDGVGLEPGEEPEIDDAADGHSQEAAAWFLSMWDREGPDSATRMAESEGPGWNALDEHVVAEVMTPAVLTVAPTTPVAEVARLMERAGIHRLVVLDEHEVVGMLTSFDLVRAVAEGRLTAETPVDLSLG